MTKIVFFSCEPGGAEALIPVAKLVQAQGQYEVAVFGYGHALERFAKKGVNCIEIGKVEKDDLSLLQAERPSLLITSATSLPAVDMSEKHLWLHARRLGIRSIAFLDQWQNYVARFSGCQEGERLGYLPDWINCLNEIGRTEMVREGFPENRLLAFGHPYLTSLKNDLSMLDIDGLRTRLNVSAGKDVVLFVSEPIREYYGEQRGYDQYQVLEYFLSTVASLDHSPKVLIKLHPKESKDSFRELATKYRSLAPQFVGVELTPLECVAVSKFVFGMTSIMLIEAYVLGKNVVSLQPGLLIEDPMVLSRHALIPVILSGEQWTLRSGFRRSQGQFPFEFSAAEFLTFLASTTSESSHIGK